MVLKQVAERGNVTLAEGDVVEAQVGNTSPGKGSLLAGAFDTQHRAARPDQPGREDRGVPCSGAEVYHVHARSKAGLGQQLLRDRLEEAGLRHQPPFFLGAVAGPGVRVRVGPDGLAHPTASLVTSDSKSAAGGAPPLTAVRAYSRAKGPCRVKRCRDGRPAYRDDLEPRWTSSDPGRTCATPLIY